MGTIYLIRHGEAGASWNQDRDPGLSDLGRQQALAVMQQFRDGPVCPIYSSPLRRVRETAGPLATHWGVDVITVPAFAEIPTPAGHSLEQRLQWLLALRDQHWDTASAELLTWRENIIAALQQLPDNALVFTHFMVMNTVVGHLMERPEYVCYQPGNGSILTLQKEGGGIKVADLGAESATRVL